MHLLDKELTKCQRQGEKRVLLFYKRFFKDSIVTPFFGPRLHGRY
jgi:hypothetical protein